MPGINLRLFGFSGPSRFDLETRAIPEGTTVRQLWEELRREAPAKSLLATIPEKKILALVNGHPINRPEKWQQLLAEGDTVSFMVMALGG